MKTYFEDSEVIVSSNAVLSGGRRFALSAISQVLLEPHYPFGSSDIPFFWKIVEILHPNNDLVPARLIIKLGMFQSHEIGRSVYAPTLRDCIHYAAPKFGRNPKLKKLLRALQINLPSWGWAINEVDFKEVSLIAKNDPSWEDSDGYDFDDFIFRVQKYQRLVEIRDAIKRALVEFR